MRATIARVVFRKTSRSLAAAAALVLGSALIAAGCGGEDSLGDADGVAVTVEATKITNAQVERYAKYLGTNVDPQTGAVPALPEPSSDAYWELRRQAAELLRDQAVYAILAKRCGKPCEVPARTINRQIAEIRTSEFNGSQADLNAALEERGITLDDLRALLLRGQQEQKLATRQERGVTFSEAQAKTYYDANIATYTTAAKKTLSHILLAGKGDATALKGQLTAANFAAVARERSLDPDAKTTGGDLGDLNGGGLIPEIAAAAASLKPGVVSAPVESQFGWHLLLVVNVPKRVAPFDEVKSQILQEQLAVKKQEKVQKWTDSVVKKVQDAATYGNDRLKPEPVATTTTPVTATATSPATTTTR